MKKFIRDFVDCWLAPAVIVMVLLMGADAIAQSDRLLDAIEQVESGGRINVVGDGGKAIGPFQIHEVYWIDAIKHDPSIGGCYADCKDSVYARKIVRAYMARYAPKNASDEVFARLHNGGANIFKKSKSSKAWKNTTAYWAQVRTRL